VVQNVGQRSFVVLS